MKKFVLHLEGPSTSGKSTIVKEISEAIPGSYVVSYDKLKWQLSDYHRDKDIPLIKRLTLGLFELVCREGIPVLIDGWISKEEEYKYCRDVAEKNGYTFVSVVLTAPLDVLLQRFRDRVIEAKKNGSRISVTDEKIFLEQTSKSKYIPEHNTTLDTSVLSVEEVKNKILELIN